MPRDPDLGHEHASERARQIAAMRNDGSDLCWRPWCQLPMFATVAKARAMGMPDWTGRLDLGHLKSRAVGGAGGPRLLEHRRCNRHAGAVLGNTLRGLRRQAGGTTPRRTRPAPRW